MVPLHRLIRGQAAQRAVRLEGFMAETGLSFFQFLKINSPNIEQRF